MSASGALSSDSSRPLAPVLALAALSAAAATTHEVVWSQLLPRLVGNTSHGRGLALALFMVGMGLGGLLGRRLLTKGVACRTGLVVCEIVIALGGGGAAAVFLSTTIPSATVGGGLAIDVAASVGIALPASLAMGATYPFLVEGSGDRPSAVSWLYVAGLAGAVGGVIISGFLIVPRFGADTAAYGAVVLNLCAAGAGLALLPPTFPPDADSREDLSHSELVKPTLVFAAGGAFGLGAQVVWNRATAPYAGVSVFTFSTIVAIYLVGEAVGMLWSRRSAETRATKAGLLALTVLPAVSVVTLGWGPSLWQQLPPRNDGHAWMLQGIAVVATSVGPTALLLGVVQGWALRMLEMAPSGHARAAGFVVGIATAASAIGGIATSLILTPHLGPRGTLLAVALPTALALLLEAPGRLVRVSIGVGLAAGAYFLSPGPVHFLGSQFDDSTALFVDINSQETTAVIVHERPTEPRVRRLVSNGVSYSGDSLFAQRYMKALGHFPALAAAHRERALVICIGTGTTAGALLTHPFSQIDAVDISPAIRETLVYFHHVHGALTEADNVTIHIDDGVRFWLHIERRAGTSSHWSHRPRGRPGHRHSIRSSSIA